MIRLKIKKKHPISMLVGVTFITYFLWRASFAWVDSKLSQHKTWFFDIIFIY